MPRPRKEPKQQRSEILQCRLTPAEHARLQQAARSASLPLSAFIRAVLIDRRVKVVQNVRTFDADLYDELRRIGVNLNQAVARFHRTGLPPPELFRAAAAVEKIVLGLIDK